MWVCQWLEPIIPALEQMARGSSCFNIVKPCLNIIIIIMNKWQEDHLVLIQ